jgi:transcription termination factor Rho
VSVLQRRELEDSPLADLHAIASELGIEGYRALRRDDLIAAILAAQGGGEAEPEADVRDEVEVEVEVDVEQRDETAEPQPVTLEPEPPGDLDGEVEQEPKVEPEPDAEVVTGTLDILPNGSGFIRVDGAGQSSGDVYVSPAQIRRCELRAGDVVSGPLRPPRRNERHPSLVRVESVNGHDAEPPEQRPRFSDLTPVNPSERLAAPAALDAVPFGKGSRVAIAGVPGAGATRLLGQIVRSLGERHDDVEVIVALVGARPEEVTGWEREMGIPVTGGSFDRSIEAQTQAVELAVERAKRLVERGGDVVVIIDSLEDLPPAPARRLFGAARKAEEGGSLTVIAAVGNATEPLRQASTRITLDAAADEPTVLLARSGTQRPDLLA